MARPALMFVSRLGSLLPAFCLLACTGVDMGGAGSGSNGKADDGYGSWDEEVRLPIAKDINSDPDVVEIDLVAHEAEVEFKPGVKSKVWTYEGGIPGPLIRAKVGDTLIVHFTNNLPEETTIHWHGVELPAEMDGTLLTQSPVPANGGTFRYEFKLLTAATYWYHPHVRGHDQVERGLYGPLVVRDPAQDAELDLPQDELTLVLDDILLDDAGQVEQVDPVDPVKRAATQVNGREGNLLLVNGRELPTVTVRSGTPIRLRTINAANARFFRLSVPGHTLHRIGGDGGLAIAPTALLPVALTADEVSDPDPALGLMLVPGERADVVFTPVGEPGTELFVEWHDFPRGRHMASRNDDGSIGLSHAHNDGKRKVVKLLRLVFDEAGDATATDQVPPSTLRDIAAIDATDAQPLPVMFGHGMPDADGNVMFFAAMKDGRGIPFDELTAEDALHATVGETRIWEVVNMTGGDHPFHAHGFFFQHLETQYMDMDNPENNRVERPELLENKDTIRVPARLGAKGQSKTIVRLAVTFDDTGREGIEAFGKDPTAGQAGGWIAHCHILEHAARGMTTFLNLRYAD